MGFEIRVLGVVWVMNEIMIWGSFLSGHKRSNSKRCLRNDFARAKSRSAFQTQDGSSSPISPGFLPTSLASRRSSLKELRKYTSLPPNSINILSFLIESKVRGGKKFTFHASLNFSSFHLVSSSDPTTLTSSHLPPTFTPHFLLCYNLFRTYYCHAMGPRFWTCHDDHESQYIMGCLSGEKHGEFHSLCVYKQNSMKHRTFSNRVTPSCGKCIGVKIMLSSSFFNGNRSIAAVMRILCSKVFSLFAFSKEKLLKRWW